MTSLNSPLRVGIAGLGRAGVHIHAAALKERPDFQIVAVCDPLEERRDEQALSLEAQAFPTLDAMLESGCCDLVVLATPSKEHFTDAQKTLKAGVHCVLEKPMAATASEARELVKLAKEVKRHLFVHHQFVYDMELRYLREVIASGKIGSVFHIDLFWTGFTRRWDWQTLRRNAGGQVMNTCPHALTLLLDLLGGDADLEWSCARLIKDAGDADDDVRMLLRGRNGITAQATISSVCALPMPRLVLYGSNGTLQEDYVTATLRFYDAAKVPNREVIDKAAPEDGSLTESLPWVDEESPVQPSKREGGNFYDNVVGTLLHGEPFQVNAAQAARIIEILSSVRRATGADES